MVSMSRKVSLAVLVLLIIVLGVTFFRVVTPFLLPLFLAGMTAVVCQPLFRYFLKRTKEHIALAAGLTTATIMASIMIPLITGIFIATLQLYTFSSRVVDSKHWQMIFRTPEVVAEDFPEDFPEDLIEYLEGEQEATPSELRESEADQDPAAPLHPVESETVPSNTDSPSSDTSSPNPSSIETPVDSTSLTTPEVTATSDPAEKVLPVKSVSSPEPQKSIVPQHSETFIEDIVHTVNVWLPKQLQREPKDVSKEIRLRIGTMLHDMGDRSLGRTAGTTFGILAGALGTVVSALIAVMIYTVALYYFLADGTALLLATESLIPVHAKYQRQLLEKFSVVVRSVVVATFLAAFAQGIATVAALWFFGFDHLFVLLILATVCALIPIAGTWLVWVPCAGMLFASGHWIQGSLLTIYGAGFVGFLDNVVRTYVLNNDTKLHPLLAFISILGGLQVMGLWGVFIGPIVASCLHALIQIFNQELQELSKDNDSKSKGNEIKTTDAPSPQPPPTLG